MAVDDIEDTEIIAELGKLHVVIRRFKATEGEIQRIIKMGP